MMTIALNNLRFFARHGLYAEEKLLPNQYEVSVVVNYHPQQLPVTELEDTVNYETVFMIICKRMQDPADLLETVATEIAIAIREKFDSITSGSVAIKKMHVPVKDWFGPAEVKYSW